MSAKEIIYVISISGCVIAGFLANMFHMMMVDQINDHRPEENQISHLRHLSPRTSQILREYRRLYPNGKLHIWALGAFAVFLISMITVIVNSLPPS